MLNDHFPRLRFPLAAADALRLPRNPAYRYRVHADHVDLEPQPRCGQAVRPTCVAAAPPTFPEGYFVEALDGGHWPGLNELFLDAFSGTLPLSVLSADECRGITDDALTRTRTGADGPVIESASFVLRPLDRSALAAAILVTLMPAGCLGDFTDPAWQEPAPVDALARHWGRPHLTWVLTSPSYTRRGFAKALLQQSLRSLHHLGYMELSSTFLLDNLPSVLWHWRCGFELQAVLSE